MPGKAVGWAAVELPWLCPSTDSLIALAENPAGLPGASVADPALACFLLRFAQPAREPDLFGLAPGALFSPLLPETAVAYLNATDSGVLPESSFVLSRVRKLATRAAGIASALADLTRLVPASAAATVVRLAPLAWYAVASVDPFDAADPLADPRFPVQPAEIQQELWGTDHSAITRRLAVRWQLPPWVASTISSLNLPFRIAQGLVAGGDLFAIAQLAILVAESEGPTLGLTHGASRGELLDHLRLDASMLNSMPHVHPEVPATSRSGLDSNPHRVPLIRPLMRLAGESRRRNGPGLVARLEGQLDAQHRVIVNLGEQVGERLREAKLAGLAELAAGAGHEINNPLAIISGNAQRLLRTEGDAERGESLQAIVRQTNRIAGLLRDLMQFARPPKPEPRVFALAELLTAVGDELAEFARERGARLEIDPVPDQAWINGDLKQLQYALGAVVRNGIEAAAQDGWVRVSSAPTELGQRIIAIEDSGPGLSPEAVEHAFDPFYCGRRAGRGRGLGLPTAWQLARQNGGELSFDQRAHGPTRFLLTLHRVMSSDVLTLRSA